MINERFYANEKSKQTAETVSKFSNLEPLAVKVKVEKTLIK